MLKAKCGRASKILWDPQTRAGAAHLVGQALCARCRLCKDQGQGTLPAGVQLGKEQLLPKDTRPTFQDKEQKPLGKGHIGQGLLLLGDRKTREDALHALGRAGRPPSPAT